MHRRDFLKAAVLAPLALHPASARAFGDTARLTFLMGRHGGRWDARSAGLRRLAYEIGLRTSIATVQEPRALPLDSKDLFLYPLVHLCGDGDFRLSDAEVENLRRYVTYGGFLLCDGIDAGAGAFADACERELARVLPGSTAGRIPPEHVLFKSFYLIEQPAGRTLERPYLSGFVQGPRLAAVISANDLGGAWARDELGSWEFEVSPGGESQREIAFRLGVNICMYAMCTDYKEDQVHIPFIMKRRR